MILANYINDLLYRYNCVIVPNFGGFVTNKVDTQLDENLHIFYPPSKKITFNSHLNINDGLLANYISSSENISFEKASQKIAFSVLEWKNEIKNNPIQIASIGVLSLNENNQIIFEPNTEANYLSESFGLASVSSIKIHKQQVKPLIPVREKENTTTPAFIKYAATAAILLTLGFGFNKYQQNKNEEVLAKQEKALEKKIQSATFVIKNPLPVIELNVTKEKVISKPYYLIAGAFQFPENALKKVSALKKQGYNATIVGVNKWGLTQVAYSSYSNRNEATNNLYKIQDTVSEDAWLLIKK